MNTLKLIILENPHAVVAAIAFSGALLYKVIGFFVCSNMDTIFYTKAQHFIKRIVEFFIIFIINILSLLINSSVFSQISYSFISFKIEVILLSMLVVIVISRIVKKPTKNRILNFIAKEWVALVGYTLGIILLSISLSFEYNLEIFHILLFFYSAILAWYIVSHVLLINNLSFSYVHYFIKDEITWFIHYSTSRKEVLCTEEAELDCSKKLHFFKTSEIKENYVINRKKRDVTVKERKNTIKNSILQLNKIGATVKKRWK